MLDVAILVPFQGHETLWLEPMLRRNQGPARLVATLARESLSQELGGDVSRLAPRWAAPHKYRVWRTAGAVTLASSAERAGLSWHAIDPGEIGLHEWRERLAALSAKRPRLVAINTTFIAEVRWLHLFCAMVRRAIPRARVALGGYYYATDARGFLASPADVFCVGEGEARFGEMALRVRDGRPLDDIPGLFLREEDGTLRSTGEKPLLRLEETPLPDWSLSTRMDPPLDPEKEPTLFHVETQRGCFFKCEFCTFRTLSEHAIMSPSRAADALLWASRGRRGRTFLADATATFPRRRWCELLEMLVNRGGSPHALSVFARVSDLDDAVCERMALAGVRHVFIGQESGDQNVLNSMRKGTKVTQVRPALDALTRRGIKATFGFISGFPGEDAAAANRTRDLMVQLNDGYAEPTALVAYLDVFAAQDLAAVSNRAELEARRHPLDYGDGAMSARAASFEALRHCLALADGPGAPVTGFGLSSLVGTLVTAFCERGDHRAGFRWLKAFDRAIAQFVRRELEGRKVDRRVLSDAKRVLLEDEPLSVRRRPAETLRRRARRLGARVLLAEWQGEGEGNAGPVTRLLVGSSVWQATRDLKAALVAMQEGAAPAGFSDVPETARASRDAEASALVELSQKSKRQRTLRRAQPEGA